MRYYFVPTLMWSCKLVFWCLLCSAVLWKLDLDRSSMLLALFLRVEQPFFSTKKAPLEYVLCICISLTWMIYGQVVIVDDGSRDGTKRVAFDFVKKYGVDNVRVILLGRNHGKGEAIRKVSLK